MYKSIACKCCWIIIVLLIVLMVFCSCASKDEGFFRDPEDVLNELRSAKVGDTVLFGAYEQDNDSSNGQERIEWIILDCTDGKALLVSKYSIDCKPYHSREESVTWATCSLRQWLNNDFLNSAFTLGEQSMIATTELLSSDDTLYPSTSKDGITYDKVFLLSETEAYHYFSYDYERKCEMSNYVKDIYGAGNPLNPYWLRRYSESEYDHTATAIAGTRGTCVRAYVTTIGFMVRPAIWVDLYT